MQVGGQGSRQNNKKIRKLTTSWGPLPGGDSTFWIKQRTELIINETNTELNGTIVPTFYVIYEKTTTLVSQII